MENTVQMKIFQAVAFNGCFKMILSELYFADDHQSWWTGPNFNDLKNQKVQSLKEKLRDTPQGQIIFMKN